MARPPLENSNVVFQQDKRFRKGESGATLVVCAVILTLIAALIIFAVSLSGEETRKAYEKVNTVPFENN